MRIVIDPWTALERFVELVTVSQLAYRSLRLLKKKGSDDIGSVHMAPICPCPALSFQKT
jgi:hypothetical protein